MLLQIMSSRHVTYCPYLSLARFVKDKNILSNTETSKYASKCQNKILDISFFNLKDCIETL